jgi:nitrate reductase (NAD(P)H)
MDMFPRFEMKISLLGSSESKGTMPLKSYQTCFSPYVSNWCAPIYRLVENPMVLNFRQILEDFEQITAPVTLVCAGNRRKEQNMVRKSKGFSWGAAGVSTALFTGPLMASILKVARPIRRRAKYVCMEGADKLV